MTYFRYFRGACYDNVLNGDDVVVIGNDIVDGYELYDLKEK